MRTDRGGVRTQFAVFYSTSDYGSTYNALTFELSRAPEKLCGAEFSVDAEVSDDWQLGASVSWVDGKTQNVTTGRWSKLDTTRIGPVKSIVYIDRALGETWKVRGQFMHSGRQSRFPNNPAVFGQADVEAYSLLDLSVSGQLGRGILALAVNNALNEDYYTPGQLALREQRVFQPRPGRDDAHDVHRDLLMKVTRRDFNSLLLGSAAASVPAWVGGCASVNPARADSLPRRSPRDQGVDSRAVLAFIDEAAAQGIELHSLDALSAAAL